MRVLPAPPPGAADRPELEALPVALDLAGPDGARTTAWVESVLGWQPVTGDGVGLSPRVRIVDVPTASTAAPTAVPSVLLVAEDDAAIAVAEATTRLRPEAVLAWPDRRSELPTTVAGLTAGSRPVPDGEGDHRVGGASGGVGTTTVTLALGALLAWRHGPTLAAVHGAVPLTVPRTVPVDGLAGPRAWSDATPVPSVPGLRVVRVERPPVDAPVAADGAGVVRDVGVGADADVLCVRRDAAGLAAIERSVAAAVVVLDDGLVPPAALRGAAGGRRLVTVPRSARVARAGMLHRVPAALPGSYLRALAPLVGPPADRAGP